jgi:DNA-binding MarR family transcriptional regulator
MHYVQVTTEADLASDLVVQAARLVRAVRRELELPAVPRVLSLLDEHGPLGITQLAELDRSSQPTMSGSVAQLVEHGLVTREPNPADARAAVITPTPAGLAELARVRRRYGEHIAAIAADHPTITTEDLGTAVTVLRALLTDSSLRKGSS